MKDFALQVSHVSKKFGQNVILHDLNFTINHNTKLAIIGHNGSGKSTLLKLLANIYAPTSGEINTFGKKMSYVPEHFPEHIRFTLGEYLLHIGTIGGESRQVVQEKIKTYCERFNIESHIHTYLKKCSKGTKQKAGLIQALLNDRDILLLDEPLTGLDDESKKTFLQIIQEKQRDMTLIFTTHEQETVDILAEEIITLEEGRIIKHEGITTRTLMKHITVRVSDRIETEELKMYGTIISEQGHIVELKIPARQSDACLFYLLNNDCSIIELKETKER